LRELPCGLCLFVKHVRAQEDSSLNHVLSLQETAKKVRKMETIKNRSRSNCIRMPSGVENVKMRFCVVPIVIAVVPPPVQQWDRGKSPNWIWISMQKFLARLFVREKKV
jgi:hypothetical protein